MTTTREKINPDTYEVELGRDGEKIVEVVVRALPGTELTTADIRNARQAVVAQLPRRGYDQALRRVQTSSDRIADYAATVRDRDLPSFKTAMLIAAYEEADGRVTDLYLARLAHAYAEASRHHRHVSVRLAAAPHRAIQTVRGHLVRARKEGLLTPAAEGREGEDITAKAQDLIVAGPPLPRR